MKLEIRTLGVIISIILNELTYEICNHFLLLGPKPFKSMFSFFLCGLTANPSHEIVLPPDSTESYSSNIRSRWLSGRASASGAGGRGFEYRPRHTKGIKNVTSDYLAWCSAL